LTSRWRDPDIWENWIETGFPRIERPRLKFPSIREKGREGRTWTFKEDCSQANPLSFFNED
jgi:hypothetical protein